MAHPTVVLNVVGLDAGLLRDHAPRLRSMAKEGTQRTIEPVFPALTCSAQSSMLTGLTPGDHGIIGNGWYDRESGEIRFWKQANQLVQGEKVWDVAKFRQCRLENSVQNASRFMQVCLTHERVRVYSTTGLWRSW